MKNLAKQIIKDYSETFTKLHDYDMKKNITTFESGAIRDTQEGKTCFTETISFTAHNRYAKYMTKKKEKYGSGNFKKGIPIESYEESLLRHIDKYFRNKYENGNDEREEDHLAAIRFNVDGIMHEEEMAKFKIVTVTSRTNGSAGGCGSSGGCDYGGGGGYNSYTRIVK